MRTKEQNGIDSKQRLNRCLSLADVAQCYRGGSSRERIRQIESGISVSISVERDYYAALHAAVRDLKHRREIVARVRAEMANEKETKELTTPDR